MRPTQVAPIIPEDVKLIKKLLMKAMGDKWLWESDADDSKPRGQFICTLALDWQSEDRNVIRRIARFDLAFINGKFYEGEAVPIQHKEDRATISQVFELAHASHIAACKNWLTVSPDEFVKPLLQDLSYNCWPMALWDDCGALLFPVLSNGAHESVVSNDNIVREGVFYKLLARDTPFEDCREYRIEWSEENIDGWKIGAEA